MMDPQADKYGSVGAGADVFSTNDELRQLEEEEARAQGSIRDGELPEKITEDGAALEFAEQVKDTLRFDHQLNDWFEWDGARWAVDRTGRALHHAREIVRQFRQGSSVSVQEKAARYSFIRAVLLLSASDRRLAINPGEWDCDPFLLGTPGGTVDLRTGLVRTASPSDHITKSTTVAPALEPECPSWLKFMSEVTQGNGEYLRFLQQWGGYCLTGSTREHALLFAFGQGGRGKGTFVNTLIGIMGDYAVTTPIETFTETHGDRHPTELARLRGARLVTASETEQGRSWAEARLKMITGGDPVAARFMRGDFFEFVPAFKLLITGNHRPSLRNVGDAERRRFNLAPFDHKPEQPDLNLAERLKAEGPAILTWLINGCIDWYQEGLQRPEIVRSATEEYFAGQDLIGAWMEERLKAVVDPKVFVPNSALYASWRDYASSRGEREGTQRSLTERLQSRGLRAGRERLDNGRGKLVRCFYGYELLPWAEAGSELPLEGR